eukprot:TRINITY_DN16228_c0_g1_i1.p1 TRINITY_DN16228_c0_g1~~TRINITY_DN16228_c0_g1_i1.p1  ORF type:complete len:137 (-),score=35.98 TRINITY_DN16228_c0_g1_i1:12-422(-)
MAARVPFVGGNWKMNGSLESTQGLASMLNDGDWSGVEVVVAPSALHLLHVKSLITNPSVALSAQNIHCEGKGAFTGETSPDMLVDAGIPWTLIGHSERRHSVSYTHLRAHETVLDLVCRLLLEKKKHQHLTRSTII